MAVIKIDVRNVISSGVATVSAQGSLSNSRSGLNSLRYQVDSKIRNSNNINNRFSSAINKISSAENRVKRLRSVVETCANSYQETDNKVKRESAKVKTFTASSVGSSAKKGKKDNVKLKKLDENHNWFEIGLNRRYLSGDKSLIGMLVSDIKNDDTYYRVFGYEFSDGLKKWFNNQSFTEYIGKIGIGGFTAFLGKEVSKIKSDLNSGVSGFKFKDLKKKLEDKAEDKGYREEYEDETYYDKDGKEISKEDAGFLDRQATILEHKIEASESVSFFDGEYDYGSGKVSATIGEAEAHAAISGGLYVMGADGTKKFSPGVKAEIGASATAFQAEWEQQWLGNDMLGLNSDVSVTAGKVGAEASGQVQIFGDDGKLNVQANVEAKAEAIAAEAEGSVGVNVLGGEVGVKGSVNIGIGAHAEIGMKDGVIKCDIGASLGVGFSVGLEVDVGGMVDTVTDAAKSAWEGVKGWFNW